jgi:hypothetical protein
VLPGRDGCNGAAEAMDLSEDDGGGTSSTSTAHKAIAHVVDVDRASAPLPPLPLVPSPPWKPYVGDASDGEPHRSERRRGVGGGNEGGRGKDGGRGLSHHCWRQSSYRGKALLLLCSALPVTTLPSKSALDKITRDRVLSKIEMFPTNYESASFKKKVSMLHEKHYCQP